MARIFITSLFFIFLSSSVVLAMSDGRLEKSNTLVQKTFDLPGKKGVAHVIIRKDGHLKDRPYQIELRPNCGNSESIELADLHVKDAHSSCKDPVGTISLSTDGNKVQLQIFKPDNQKIQKSVSDGISLKETPCLDSGETVEFDLTRFCQ